MKLTHIAVRNAKPKEKPYKLADGGGMYLLVEPSGAKYWRLKYTYAGREKLMALGVYPQVSLQEARIKRDEAKTLLAKGINPAGGDRSSFTDLAKEWHRIQKPKWKPGHAVTVWRRVQSHLIPYLPGQINDITPMNVLECVRRLQDAGKTHLAHRALQYANNIFRLAVIEGRLKYNPASDLSGALMPHKGTKMRTIPSKELPALLAAMEGSQASMVVKLATLLTMHTFLRSSELRGGRWEEIDWKQAVWVIPAERMKMKEEHIVPLSRQVISYLKEMKKLNGDEEYIFAALAAHGQKHPVISENAINNFLDDIGFGEKLVGHGFRALASTVLNEELEFPPDVIERQLAHRERNAVRAAYNRAKYLPQRKAMMQAWSDYIEAAASASAKPRSKTSERSSGRQ